MDAEIFANRSVKYNFNSISATLICLDNYNFDKFIIFSKIIFGLIKLKTKINFIFLIIVSFFIFIYLY